MALSSTIYKFSISLSDLDRNKFETLNLTVAQHPSETAERMMVRVLCYGLHAQEFLQFTKGLSTPELPDIWSQSLDGQTLLWLDVGEPNADRIKKATRGADDVWVYSFNSKSDVWWSQEQSKFEPLAVKVRQFSWGEVVSLAALLERKMDFSLTISGDLLYVATALGECELVLKSLQD